MKTSFLVLFTSMLAAAHAAPLPPTVSAAIGCGVSAASQLRVTPTNIVTCVPLAPRVTLVVPAVPAFVAPVAARAVRAR